MFKDFYLQEDIHIKDIFYSTKEKSSFKKDSFFRDGEFTLSILKKCNDEIGLLEFGICSLGSGLDLYYNHISRNETPEDLQKKYDVAKEATKGKIGIVQFQFAPESKEIRKECSVRNRLIKKVISLESISDEKIDFFLSAELNKWVNPYVIKERLEDELPVPTLEGLKINYDYTAKRHGFTYDPETKLFWRK